MAIAIALGATSMSNIAVQAPVLSAAAQRRHSPAGQGFEAIPSTAPPAVTYRHAGLRRGSQPTTVPVKLPVFCLAACVRMRYFTCAHQPTLTGAVMWWSRLPPNYRHLRVREEWGRNHGERLSRCHGRHQSGWHRSFDPVR